MSDFDRRPQAAEVAHKGFNGVFRASPYVSYMCGAVRKCPGGLTIERRNQFAAVQLRLVQDGHFEVHPEHAPGGWHDRARLRWQERPAKDVIDLDLDFGVAEYAVSFTSSP